MYYLALILLLLSSCTNVQLKPYKLVNVIDGDSLLLQSSECIEDQCDELEVRLIGLDAPEFSQDPWGKRARAFILDELEEQSSIYLETDIRERDKYGRTLGYIFYRDNTADKHNANSLKFLNEEILKNGYAEIFIFAKNRKYLDILKSSEALARQSKLNIWQAKTGLKLSPSKYRRKYMKKSVQ